MVNLHDSIRFSGDESEAQNGFGDWLRAPTILTTRRSPTSLSRPSTDRTALKISRDGYGSTLSIYVLVFINDDVLDALPNAITKRLVVRENLDGSLENCRVIEVAAVFQELRVGLEAAQ